MPMFLLRKKNQRKITLINPTSAGDGLKRAFSTINIYSNDGRNIVKIGSKNQESIWNLKGVEKYFYENLNIAINFHIPYSISRPNRK